MTALLRSTIVWVCPLKSRLGFARKIAIRNPKFLTNFFTFHKFSVIQTEFGCFGCFTAEERYWNYQSTIQEVQWAANMNAWRLNQMLESEPDISSWRFDETGKNELLLTSENACPIQYGAQTNSFIEGLDICQDYIKEPIIRKAISTGTIQTSICTLLCWAGSLPWEWRYICCFFWNCLAIMTRLLVTIGLPDGLPVALAGGHRDGHRRHRGDRDCQCQCRPGPWLGAWPWGTGSHGPRAIRNTSSQIKMLRWVQNQMFTFEIDSAIAIVERTQHPWSPSLQCSNFRRLKINLNIYYYYLVAATWQSGTLQNFDIEVLNFEIRISRYWSQITSTSKFWKLTSMSGYFSNNLHLTLIYLFDAVLHICSSWFMLFTSRIASWSSHHNLDCCRWSVEKKNSSVLI
jgi:hypothetical protein